MAAKEQSSSPPTNLGSFLTGKELQALADADAQTKQLISELKELESAWQEKERIIREFIRGWNSRSEDLKALENHIKVEVVLVKKEERLYQREEHKTPVLRLMAHLRDLMPQITNKELGGKIKGLLEHHEQDMNELARILHAQRNFLDIYANEDIGLVYFHLGDFVALLKKEGEILGLEEGLMRQLEEAEKYFNSLFKVGITRKLSVLARNRLNEWGIPVERYPQLGDFLLSHWKETNEIARAAKPYERVVLSSLWYFQDEINERGLKKVGLELAEIAKAGERFAIEIFKFLAENKEITKKHGLLETGLGLAELLKPAILEPATVRYASSEKATIEEILTNLKHLLIEYDLKTILEITRGSSIIETSSTTYGILNGSEMIRTYGRDKLFEIIKSAGTKYGGSILDRLRVLGTNQYRFDVLFRLVKEAKPEQIGPLFEDGLYACQEIITDENLERIGRKLIELGNHFVNLRKYTLTLRYHAREEGLLRLKYIFEPATYSKLYSKLRETLRPIYSKKTLIQRFGEKIFDELLLPFVRSQGKCMIDLLNALENLEKEYPGPGTFTSNIEDLKFFIEVWERYGDKGYYIVKHYIRMLHFWKIISTPVSTHKDLIFSIIDNFPDDKKFDKIKDICIIQGAVSSREDVEFLTGIREQYSDKFNEVIGILKRALSENIIPKPISRDKEGILRALREPLIRNYDSFRDFYNKDREPRKK